MNTDRMASAPQHRLEHGRSRQGRDDALHRPNCQMLRIFENAQTADMHESSMDELVARQRVRQLWHLSAIQGLLD